MKLYHNTDLGSCLFVSVAGLLVLLAMGLAALICSCAMPDARLPNPPVKLAVDVAAVLPLDRAVSVKDESCRRRRARPPVDAHKAVARLTREGDGMNAVDSRHPENVRALAARMSSCLDSPANPKQPKQNNWGNEHRSQRELKPSAALRGCHAAIVAT